MLHIHLAETIVTRPGRENLRDSFLAVAFALALSKGGITRIERRQPTPSEINNPAFLVIGVGDKWMPANNSYDVKVAELPQDNVLLSVMANEFMIQREGAGTGALPLWMKNDKGGGIIEEAILCAYAAHPYIDTTYPIMWSMLLTIGEKIITQLTLPNYAFPHHGR